MKYYVIEKGTLLIADNAQALSKFYSNVKPLPDDYVEGKYIVVEKQEEIEVTDYDPETGEPIGTHTETIIVYELALNPDFEAEEAEKEKERVARLSCTKRDFVLLLQEQGISYRNTLKPLIDADEQASIEWELCERLYRFNPLLDQMAGVLGITSAQLDTIFKVANGEAE